MNDAIGGSFWLELPSATGEWHKNSIQLNTARNCLEYILRVRGYKRVYIPLYTCSAVLEPFERLGVERLCYSINMDLEPINLPTLKDNEAFLYTNYFGLKNGCVKRLKEYYADRLIVDCAQAFFYNQPGTDIFYSARKFIGVVDGGYLKMNSNVPYKALCNLSQDISYGRMMHLFKRMDEGAEAAYIGFRQAEDALDNRSIKLMSNVTQHMLESVNYNQVQKRRCNNFKILHDTLNQMNVLENICDINDDCVPLIYPLYCEDASKIREKLRKNRIFTAQYWPNILRDCTPDSVEYNMASNIVSLPVDQRYNEEDMNKILKIVTI